MRNEPPVLEERARGPSPYQPLDIARLLPVLHEDADLLVIAKPSGIPLKSDTREEGPVSLLRTVATSTAGPTDRRSMHIIHRLGTTESGLLILGKTVQAAEALSESFRTQKVEQTYLAVVKGKPKPSKAPSRRGRPLHHEPPSHRM